VLGLSGWGSGVLGMGEGKGEGAVGGSGGVGVGLRRRGVVERGERKRGGWEK